MAREDNPFFDLVDYSAGPPRDAMYSGFVPGTNPMALKAEKQRRMREAKQLTPAAALLRGLGEGYFGDVTTPNAEQGYSVMDPSNRAPAGREAEMQRYRDIGTALGIGADPITMLAPLAKPAVKAVGRGALAAAQSDTAYDLANRVASATGASPLYAVKPKGGNWAPPINLDLPSKRLAGSEANANSDSVTRALSPLRTSPYSRFENPNLTAAEVDSLNANVADPLNRWLDKKLASYVRNEMGTPDDPIRLMHEQGYSHSPAIRGMEENVAGTWTPQRVADARSEAGFPEEGFAVRRHAEAGYPEENLLNARRAEEWETLSDSAIDPNIAGNYQEDIQLGRQRLENRNPEFKSILGDWDPNVEMAENSPWIEKLDPNTPIYRIADSQTFSSDLDFNHLIDELRASLSPNSELPAHLRLTPETLNKVSVADAVKRVSEINDWRALQAEKAERAGMLENLNSNARLADPTAKLSFVEKPGMTWADIPEVIDEKGTKLCTSIGKAGGWCTMNASTAQRYGSGENRLVAMLDAEGRPHAQAMISTSNYDHSQMHLGDVLHGEDAVGDQYYRNLQTLLERRGINPEDAQRYVELEAFGSPREIPAEIQGLMNELSSEAESMIPKKQTPLPDIAELKPPGNAFSSDRSEVYKKRDPEYKKKISESVLKFLNSGEWGSVNDLNLYNIVDLQRDPHALSAYLRDITGKNNQASEAIFDAAMAANPDAPRFMIREQFKEFLKPFIPQAEGYAKGGAVHMQAGGAVSLARRLFKTPVAELGRAGIMSKSGKILTETFTPEELDLIQNSVVMSRRKTLDDLAGADKRLKSVHETNRTGAASGPLRSKQTRAEREPEMFGALGQTYGYLTLDPLATLSGELSSRFPKKGAPYIAPTSQIPEYGRFGLVLHPELRSRTTFTIDDSLDRTLGPQASTAEVLRPSPYDDGVAAPGSRLHELAVDYDATLRDIVERLKDRGVQNWEMQDKLREELTRMNKPVTFAELLRSEGLPPIGDDSGFIRLPRQIPRMLDNPTEPSLLPSEIYQLGGDDTTHFRKKLMQRDPMGYVEAQMHGDVTPEHIQRIYDFGYEPSLKAEKQAKKLGIDYIPRPEAAYDIIKRKNPQTMGEFYRLAEELGVLPDYLKGRESDSAMLPFGGNYAKGGSVKPQPTNPFYDLV